MPHFSKAGSSSIGAMMTSNFLRNNSPGFLLLIKESGSDASKNRASFASDYS
jgi:hypothetical protein